MYTVQLYTEHSFLCVAEPRVVAHCQGPTKGNLTLVCTVDSSAPYSLSWLCGGTNITAQNNTKSVYHAFRNQSGHFLVVTGASKQDLRKDYTCVVTTAFRQTARHFYCCKFVKDPVGMPSCTHITALNLMFELIL